ncbi:helix-turn-helix transcriptional regulator [Mucilaginibacter sp. X4EP1]|uniref:helix-turn-helix transcriptional regulator n=1 Tax=Mucilaginibacter sp. X4EP1 TaxID=2723092 RepID=UPI0021699B6E|nr:AraC family transcriptional regulator [Mucilaginibacter sp. X4EP1]MCS3816190.1 AraC-like DNA-binding protein [Mucilaginibacter sp. X4EP1]
MHDIHSNNIIAFTARHAIVDIHYHMCYQIVVSMQTPFNCTIGGQTYAQIKGFLINQKVTHLCEALNTTVMVFFIDAESIVGWQIKEMLAGRPFLDIESILSHEQLAIFTTACAQADSANEMRKVADNLLEQILSLGTLRGNRIIDDRMVKILEYIEANQHDSIVLEDIAELVFLSPERARHLFAQQTGIPFSQYLLWKRIKAVLTQVIGKNVPMINAILENGFTDQAHFTHLFKRTFGVSAKLLLKNSRSIQFLKPQL